MFAATVAAAGFLLTSLPASADPTPNCGGLNEKSCKAKKATFVGKALNKKPKGAFLSIRKGGEYWKCPKGYKRSIFPVTGKKACAKGLSKFKKAEFLGKAFQKKPKGAFFDPRKGGEYWSCPKAYFRGVLKVTGKSACLPKLSSRCDSGKVYVRGICKKRKVCGKEGDRPCLLIERIPSCNKGLLEEFFSNKCLKPEALIAKAMAKMIGGAMKGAKAAGKAEEKVEKAVGKVAKAALKVVLGKKGYKKLTKGFKSIKKEQMKVEKKLAKITKPLTKRVEKAISKDFLDFADAMKKNKKKIAKLLSSEAFYLEAPAKKIARFVKALGFNPGIAGSNAFFTFGIAASYAYNPKFLKVMGLEIGAGPTVAIYGVTDFKGQFATRLSLGVGASTDGGADVKLIAGVVAADKAADVGGGGFSIGIGVDTASRASKSKDGVSRRGLSGEFNILVNGSNLLLLEGFEIGIGLASKENTKLTVSGGVGWAYDFPLGKAIKLTGNAGKSIFGVVK
jgi:hypothetical protein